MMAEAKFKAGDSVFVIGFLSRTPGEISKVRQNENGEFIYDVIVGGRSVSDIRETAIIRRKILAPPKYALGDIVRFKGTDGNVCTGKIRVVDPYGTMEQDEEPSYDIEDEGDDPCLYKHIRESWLIE